MTHTNKKCKRTILSENMSKKTWITIELVSCLIGKLFSVEKLCNRKGHLDTIITMGF